MADKPIIEVCKRSGSAAARLATNHDLWARGDDPYHAVDCLLKNLAHRRMEGRFEGYTVKLLPPNIRF